jgi:pyrroline-5-carboxylate reductase
MEYSESVGSRVAILGGGNLGQAIALGWAERGGIPPSAITITRRQPDRLSDFAEQGFDVTADNAAAVRGAGMIVIAVQPKQVDRLLAEIIPALDPAVHRLVSVVSGVTIEALREKTGRDVPIVRAMPNTGVAIGESMTCLAGSAEATDALGETEELFAKLGRTLILSEEMMTPATALCACGVAFFLRCVRAASQGGIEIGFHPAEALLLAAQTARGAASLLLDGEGHPEREIDRVTTPRGCTIAGLNEMEHQGLSSALIRGIVISARKAEGLAD